MAKKTRKVKKTVKKGKAPVGADILTEEEVATEQMEEAEDIELRDEEDDIVR